MFIAEPNDYYRTYGNVTATEIVEQAKAIIANSLKRPGETFTHPDSVRTFLQLQLSNLKREVFSCLFLDNKHRLIEYRELFFGTIDGASVYPREIVKLALELNAAAVILAHNHPSGDPEPSQADINITSKIKDALSLMDIRTLDHIIVGHGESVSFAEKGLL